MPSASLFGDEPKYVTCAAGAEELTDQEMRAEDRRSGSATRDHSRNTMYLNPAVKPV